MAHNIENALCSYSILIYLNVIKISISARWIILQSMLMYSLCKYSVHLTQFSSVICRIVLF